MNPSQETKMEVLNPKQVDVNSNEESNCSRCGLFSKLATANISHITGKRLYRSWCLSCEKLRKDTWRKKNIENHSLKCRLWTEKNPDKKKAISRKHLDKNPDSGKEARKIWKQVNKDRVNLSTATRRRRLKEATPKLNELDKQFILEIYTKAQATNLEVDHIIPLRHPEVCGLHCPVNLQLLGKSENSSKGNRWEMNVNG